MSNEKQGPPPAASGEPTFPIVGIGASAGGLEAIERLLGRLKPSGIAIVVLQHLPPGRESALPEILARATSLRVSLAADGEPIRPDHVYVASPDSDIRIEGRAFRLTSPPDPAVPRRTIDLLLRSLAEDAGRAAIGILLSGGGSDGTEGLRAIREGGGITFAQEPATAVIASMPQSALDAGVADFCLSPAEIGDELMRLGAHSHLARGSSRRAGDEAVMSSLFARLRAAYGIDFAAYKRGTIERRVERRVALHKLGTLEEYLAFIDANPAELGLLRGDLLIGVTGFFRDGEVFEALRTRIFPRLIEGRGVDAPLRIWVAGCATGEEAFSIAICLLECLGDRAGAQKMQIFATDVDEGALATARHALYSRSIELEVTPDRLQRFFSLEERGYRVSRRVRDMVVFARHDLGRDPPFSRLDLVSCRNVLIYMQPPLQHRVLRLFHYALNPGGVLLLGLSESAGEASDQFAVEDRRLKLFTRQGTAAASVFDVGGHHAGGAGEGGAGLPPRAALSVQQLAERKLLERYAPPGVLVTADLEVLQFRGQTGPYLEPVPGAATLSLAKLVRPELVSVVRASLQEARRTHAPATSPPIRTGQGPSATIVTIEVLPVALEAEDNAGCYLVLFRGPPPPAPPRPGQADAEVALDPRYEALERELAATQESHQATVEELEAANEEMQSANEELQSGNEELQSTNEELETSKEELQSANEELATVNDELQSRMVQLGAISDDLRNLVGSTSAAILIVGTDRRIRLFSTAAERLLNLVTGDVGRPIAYIRTVMMAKDLEQSVTAVIDQAVAREQRVRSTDGYWYTMRIVPYRTADNAVRGAVLEFARDPGTGRVAAPGELGDLSTEVLATLPQALLLLDDRLRVLWGNRALFELAHVETEVFGRPLAELWHGGIDPELQTLLEDAAAGGSPFSDVVVEQPFGVSDAGPVEISARPVPAAGARGPLTLVVIAPCREVSRGA